MKKLLIIGLIAVVGCAQAVKTDVGKSESTEVKPVLTQEERIIELVKKLGDADWQKREEVTKKLTEIGLPAEPFLRKLLKNQEPEVVFRAKIILYNIEIRKLLKLCSKVFVEVDQGDEYYMNGCDCYARARTLEDKNTTIRLLIQAKQYYNTAEQTLRAMPLQENEQIKEIYSLLLQAIRENIDSVSIVYDVVDQMIKGPIAIIDPPPGRGAITKKHSADAKLIKVWDKIRELMGDKKENEEQYLPPNIAQYIDKLKKRLDLLE